MLNYMMSGDEDESEDEDELCSTRSEGATQFDSVLQFDCRNKGKTSPGCGLGTVKVPSEGVTSLTSEEDEEDKVLNSKAADPGTLPKKKDGQSQNVDTDNNQMAGGSSGQKRTEVVDRSANTDLTLINAESHLSIKSVKCRSRGLSTREDRVGPMGLGKPKSRKSFQSQKQGGKVPEGKIINRNFKQQINMVSKISLNISPAKSQGKSIGNQRLSRNLSSDTAQAYDDPSGEPSALPTTPLSKTPLTNRKSLEKNRVQIPSWAEEMSERGSRLNPKALEKGGRGRIIMKVPSISPKIKALDAKSKTGPVVKRIEGQSSTRTSGISKSRQSSVAEERGSHQKRTLAERPKSTDAVLFLKEKILIQENDRSKSSKVLLDTKCKVKDISRIGDSSRTSRESRGQKNLTSVKIFGRVRRRSKSPPPPPAPSIPSEFSKFIFLRLPIIWSFGLTQISIARNVEEVLETMKRRHSFHEINLDLEILKWKTTPGFLKFSEGVLEPGNFHDAILFRASKILRKGRSSLGLGGMRDLEKAILSTSEVLQLLKLAMLSAQATLAPRGYILKNFPVSSEEGIEFELLLYPSTAALYFLNNHWSKNRSSPPDVLQLSQFSRIHGYSEYEVERAADHFGSKTIKVSNAEDLHGRRVTDLVSLVQFHINGDRETLRALGEKNRIHSALRRSRKKLL